MNRIANSAVRAIAPLGPPSGEPREGSRVSMIMIFCQILRDSPVVQGLHVVHGIEQHRILGILHVQRRHLTRQRQ